MELETAAGKGKLEVFYFTHVLLPESYLFHPSVDNDPYHRTSLERRGFGLK